MPGLPVEIDPARDLAPEEREIVLRATGNIRLNLPRPVERRSG
jgi:hypothetical protein